jgi:hypothetical protein
VNIEDQEFLCGLRIFVIDINAARRRLRSLLAAAPTKLHHAGMDGKAPGTAIARAIFGLTAPERQIRPPHAELRGNQYQLGAVELATAAVSNTVPHTVLSREPYSAARGL